MITKRSFTITGPLKDGRYNVHSQTEGGRKELRGTFYTRGGALAVARTLRGAEGQPIARVVAA